MAKERYISFMRNFRGDVCPACRTRPEAGIILHHVDPTKKLFSLGDANNYQRTAKEIIDELAKCVRLCALCHHAAHQRLREIAHNGGTNHEKDSGSL